MPVLWHIPVLEHMPVLEKNSVTGGKAAKIAEIEIFWIQFKIA